MITRFDVRLAMLGQIACCVAFVVLRQAPSSIEAAAREIAGQTATVQVSGTVVDESFNAISQVEVTAYSSSRAIQSCRTNINGKYAMTLQRAEGLELLYVLKGHGASKIVDLSGKENQFISIVLRKGGVPGKTNFAKLGFIESEYLHLREEGQSLQNATVMIQAKLDTINVGQEYYHYRKEFDNLLVEHSNVTRQE